MNFYFTPWNSHHKYRSQHREGNVIKNKTGLIGEAIYNTRNQKKKTLFRQGNVSRGMYEYENKELLIIFETFRKMLNGEYSQFFLSRRNGIGREGDFLSSVKVYKFNFVVEFTFPVSVKIDIKDSLHSESYKEYIENGYVYQHNSFFFQSLWENLDLNLYKAILEEYVKPKRKSDTALFGTKRIDIISIYNKISQGKLVTELPKEEFQLFKDKIEYLHRFVEIQLHEKGWTNHYKLFNIFGGELEEDEETGYQSGSLFISIDYKYQEQKESATFWK